MTAATDLGIQLWGPTLVAWAVDCTLEHLPTSDGASAGSGSGPGTLQGAQAQWLAVCASQQHPGVVRAGF